MKRALTLVTVAFIIWVGYEVYQAGRDEAVPPGSVPMTMGKGQANGFRITTHSWSFEYDKVVSNPDETVMELEGIHNGIFYKNGKPYLRLRARHVTLNMPTHNFSANGPLHIETMDRTSARALDTTAAIWDDGAQLLTLPNKTTLSTAGTEQPLTVGKVTINVRTGAVHIDQIAGHVAL